MNRNDIKVEGETIAGDKVTIDDYSFSPTEVVEGRNEIQITYKNLEYIIYYTVMSPKMVSIDVECVANNLQVGDILTSDMFKVTGTYENGDNIEFKEFLVKPESFDESGKKEVAIIIDDNIVKTVSVIVNEKYDESRNNTSDGNWKEANNEIITETTEEYYIENKDDLINDTIQQNENINIINLVIQDIDGTPLCNSKISIIAQTSNLCYDCYTDESGYANINLDEMYDRIGMYNSYIINKYTTINYGKIIGYLNFLDGMWRYKIIEPIAGFELLTVDHHKGTNMEYALSQDDQLTLFTTNKNGMAYIYEFDAGKLNINTKTEIYIKVYSEDNTSYTWRPIGITYLDSCNSEVFYHDDYFN